MTLQELTERYHRQQIKKYSSVPKFAIPKTKFTDKNSGGLTKCITTYIRLLGGYAERINNMGVWKKEKIIDKGYERIVVPGRYIKPGTRKGIADIMAIKNGKMVGIEVKIGKDKQSESQKQVENEMTQAGGHYIIAKSFENFIKQWKEI